MTRHVGFTGTRKHPTSEQQHALLDVFEQLRRDGFDTLHHGCCVGADGFAHKHWHGSLVVHPPDSKAFMVRVTGGEWRKPAPYLTRNKAIVDESELLVACPADVETIRSGTWSTVRYARKLGRPIVIICQNGTVTRECEKA